MTSQHRRHTTGGGRGGGSNCGSSGGSSSVIVGVGDSGIGTKNGTSSSSRKSNSGVVDGGVNRSVSDGNSGHRRRPIMGQDADPVNNEPTWSEGSVAMAAPTTAAKATRSVLSLRPPASSSAVQGNDVGGGCCSRSQSDGGSGGSRQKRALPSYMSGGCPLGASSGRDNKHRRDTSFSASDLGQGNNGKEGVGGKAGFERANADRHRQNAPSSSSTYRPQQPPWQAPSMSPSPSPSSSTSPPSVGLSERVVEFVSCKGPAGATLQELFSKFRPALSNRRHSNEDELATAGQQQQRLRAVLDSLTSEFTLYEVAGVFRVL